MAAQKKERKVEFRPKPGFKDRYDAFLEEDPDIDEMMQAFLKSKGKIPPDRLPAKMMDHKLDGKLKGIKECHLAGDILLVYTHENDVIELIDVCRHEGLKGKKGKALKSRAK
jgi:addiction module RelE/StbE family toxin